MGKLKKFKEVIKRIKNEDLEVGGDYYRYEGPRVSSSQLGIATHISNYERKVRTTLYFVYGPHGRLEAVGLRAYRDPLIPEDIHIAFEELSGKKADKLYKKIEPLKITMDRRYKEIYNEVYKSSAKEVSARDIDKCKKLIKKWVYDGCDGGFFDCSNIAGDKMEVLFESSGLTLELCYYWGYFECFTDPDTFSELEEYYEQCVEESERGEI